MKKWFLNDKYQPYTYSFLIFVIILFIEFLYCFKIPDEKNIIGLGNIFITVVSIFVGFLGVGLTLVYQSKDNPNIIMLKKNNKFNLLISYFKEAIIFSLISIVFGIFVSVGVLMNIYIFLLLITLNLLVILLNYRIIHFLFKIIED